MVLDKPGYPITIHINIYLSTAGKETEFIQELAMLEDTIANTVETYPDSTIFIRGDANAAIGGAGGSSGSKGWFQCGHLLH